MHEVGLGQLGPTRHRSREARGSQTSVIHLKRVATSAWPGREGRGRLKLLLQVQNSIFIENNARRGSLKVRLEKWRPLHAKIQVVLVMADDPLKVRFRLEF